MKRIIGMLLCICIFCCLLSGCGSSYFTGNNGYAPYLPGSLKDGMIKDSADPSDPSWNDDGNVYTEIIENPFIDTEKQTDSIFSIDINTASYPNLRKLINNGYNVYRDAVRVEEMLNYFKYDYEKPRGEHPIAMSASVVPCPWNTENRLVTVGIATEDVEIASIRNNFVFLLDVSGSMYSNDRLPLVQQAFYLLTENLNNDDRISIVTYAGEDSIRLDGAYGYEKSKITAVVEDLVAGGSTAGAAGIQTAYKLAEKYFIKGGNNRVILATDGDFNVGVSSSAELENMISAKRQTGINLSIIGVGYGNLQSEKMERLALAGNGNWAYVDTVLEAKRLLVEEMGGTLVTVAKDVKAKAIFNADTVEKYRLIGYENKLLTEEEWQDETTDAGELGAGFTLTVVYEIKLRDGVSDGTQDTIADVNIRYKAPDAKETDESKEIILRIDGDDFTPLSGDASFVSCVVEFALILRDSKYKGNASLTAVSERLDSLDLSGDEYKQEFADLVEKYRDHPANRK